MPLFFPSKYSNITHFNICGHLHGGSQRLTCTKLRQAPAWGRITIRVTCRHTVHACGLLTAHNWGAEQERGEVQQIACQNRGLRMSVAHPEDQC